MGVVFDMSRFVSADEQVVPGKLDQPAATERLPGAVSSGDPSEAADRLAARWLEAALIASPEKAGTLARVLKVSEAMVSHYRSGRKPTPLRALFGLDRTALVALVEAMMRDLLPEYELRRKDRMTRERAQNAVTRSVCGHDELIQRLVLERAAREEGVDVAEMLEALRR